jgi:sulfur relay (sulfurtransferase) complex TusBCD TusD component (DsrE family)
MEAERSLQYLQKPTDCQYTEHSCKTAARNRGVFRFHSCENETWFPHLRYGVESKDIINISENPDADMCN